MAATAAIVLIIGLMAGTTTATRLSASADGAAAAAKPKATPTPTPEPTPTPSPTPTPTPTPTSDSRDVYFGDAPASTDGLGTLDLTPATVGNTFVFDVVAENRGNQTLTHATFGLGGGAAVWPDQTAPSLPAGVSIVDAVIEGDVCSTTPTFPSTSFSCDIGNFAPNASVKVTFRMTSSLEVNDQPIWASFKVAENTGGDSGANKNTFFAESHVSIAPTDSDHNADFIETGPFALSTKGNPPVDGDVQSTSVAAGPNSTAAGFISIVEENNPTGCPNAGCIGQTVVLNVNDGAPVTPYLEWLLEIKGIGGGSKGGIVHELDSGILVNIPNTPAYKCSSSLLFDCIQSYVVDKNDGMTYIGLRTGTNGKTKAY